MIIAPAIMTNEKDQKKAAQKCFDSVGLDPDFYRIGHTKASYYTILQQILLPPFSLRLFCLSTLSLSVCPPLDFDVFLSCQMNICDTFTVFCPSKPLHSPFQCVSINQHGIDFVVIVSRMNSIEFPWAE